MTENKINEIALNLITAPETIDASHERYVYNAGYNDGVLDVCDSLKEALSEEDKSAEKQKSADLEDAVSREAVLDIIKFEKNWLSEAKSNNADTILAFSAIMKQVKNLSSVTPAHKKGKK